MSRFWGYSKRPKNWHKLLREELTDEELDKAVDVAKFKTIKEFVPAIVAKYKSLPPEEKPKIEKPNISATVIKPVYSASPVSASLVYSASPVYSVSPD